MPDPTVGVMPVAVPDPTMVPAPAQPVYKKGIDVYTMMLVVSSISMLLACIFLAIEYARWSG